MGDNKHKVFISYMHEDRSHASQLALLLKAHKFEPWLDIEQLDLAKELKSQISKGINQSDFFILLLSEKTAKSHWVEFELELAKKTLMKRNMYKVDLVNHQLLYEPASVESNESEELIQLLRGFINI